MAIPQTVLVVSGPFGATLSAGDVARAIARGLRAGGLTEPDICPIEVARSAVPRTDSRAAAGARAKPALPRATAASGSETAPERDRRAPGRATSEIAALLAGLDFDTRMRGARAVVLAEECLHERTLRGSVAFEIATRARQGGVPAYGVTAENALAPFDARILDLQVILEASDPRALAAAGRKLAQVL